MILFVVLLSIVFLSGGYILYGKFLSAKLSLNDSKITPAVQLNDGVDYVPAKASLLLGQHFSAIAAAGPIVGPILAGLWFGWLPALLWILIGAVFIGGVHDFMSMIASVRHRGESLGEIVSQYMSPTSKILFLTFVWFALIYVIIAFTDITAQTFKAVSMETAFGPGVVVSSFLYLFLGLIMGLALYKLKLKLWLCTIIFLPLVFIVIWIGTVLPPSVISVLSGIPVKTWEVALLAYCFAASLIPMWLLLQPRGYLGGWFLYLTMIVALAGALFGGYSIQYPALNLSGLRSLENGKLLFPILFITVACGACSGFHGIVSTGTTSKQISRESDTRKIGYGGMLLEGLVAILALVTVMILPKGSSDLKADPNFIYAKGLAQYLNLTGVSINLALSFALLAFSTFVYDTLDVSTRLARYIFQEMVGWKSKTGAVGATLITLLLPMVFLMATKEKGYLVAWPIFGTSNQLLASLTLLVLSVWITKKTGKKAFYTLIPMAFMLIITLWSLFMQIMPFLQILTGATQGTQLKSDVVISGICGIVLFILCLWLVIESVKILSAGRKDNKQISSGV